MPENELTALHHSALEELGNIGTSHAATALSILLNCRVDCQPPHCFILNLTEISQYFKNPDEVSVGIFQRLNGKLEGSLLILFSRKEAVRIANLVLGTGGDDGSKLVLGEVERSALAEVGNILGGSFMTALSQMTNLFSLPSVPHCMVDLAGAILETAVLDLMQTGEQIIFIETIFFTSGREVEGKILFFPNPASIKTLFANLGL